MPLGIKPTVDFAFKKIFGSPGNASVLIGLLNAILRLPSPIVRVEILNPFSYQEFAEEKLIVLDIRARDSEGRWLNVEMQVTVFGGLLERLVYNRSPPGQRWNSGRSSCCMRIGMNRSGCGNCCRGLTSSKRSPSSKRWHPSQRIERCTTNGRRRSGVLQQLLHQDPTATANLLERFAQELEVMLSDLQQQLRSRGL
jgi:hypothetical protein